MDDRFTVDQAVRLLTFALPRYDRELTIVAFKVLLTTGALAAESLSRALTEASSYALGLPYLLEDLASHHQIDLLLSLLRHRKSRIRQFAIETLGRMGTHYELDAIATAMSDPDQSVRNSAQKILTELQGRQDRRPERKRVHETNETLSPRERIIAALILDMPEPKEITVLLQLLGHSHADIRNMAKDALVKAGDSALSQVFDVLAPGTLSMTPTVIQLLGELRDPRGVKYLISPDLPNERAKTLAIQSLAEIADEQAIKQLVLYLDEEYFLKEVRKALKHIGKPAASAILQAFAEQPRIRRYEADLLASVAGSEALAPLLEAMQDRYRKVRDNAASGLQALGGVAVKSLIDLLVTEDIRTRENAAVVLGNIGDPKAFEPLARMAEDGHVNDRLAAISALGGFPSDQSIGLLSEALHSREWRIRKQAAESLGRIGKRAYVKHPRIVDALIKALGDRETEVGRSASDALVKIGEPALYLVEQVASTALPYAMLALETQQKIQEEIQQSQFLAQPLPEPPSTSEIHGPITDAVDFSVTAPRLASPGSSFILDVWAHLDSYREIILERAKQADRGHDIVIRSQGPVQVERGTTMRVVLRCLDFGVEDMVGNIYWTGKIGNCAFHLSVPLTAQQGSYIGTACVFVGSLQIARLYFDLEVGVQDEEVEDMTTGQLRMMSAFASYANEDRDEVLGRIQGMQKVLPYLDVFLDVASLRSGEDWEERIKEEIITRDTFYLFWSLAASRSSWVELEWKIALSAKGIAYIDPVPLDSPSKVPPPPELASLHFNEWTLAYRSDPSA